MTLHALHTTVLCACHVCMYEQITVQIPITCPCISLKYTNENETVAIIKVPSPNVDTLY